MTDERSIPTRISQHVRSAVMALVYAVDDTHKLTHGPGCKVCDAALRVLAVLEDEQREYGPPLDVTGPSWLRDHPDDAALERALAGGR